jgi:hypothetical protein
MFRSRAPISLSLRRRHSHCEGVDCSASGHEGGMRETCGLFWVGGGRYVRPSSTGSAGFATVELAVNLISLTAVFVFLAAGLSWGYSQFVVTDAARSAARMIARGEASADIEVALSRKFPRVAISFQTDDDLVAAKAVISPWAPDFVPIGLVPAISATATADVEGWGRPVWQ